MDTTPPPSTTTARPGLAGALAVAALVAGTMDYGAAITNYTLNGGKTPILIAHYIASSLLGKETAYNGGWVTASFGIFVHYLIATGWTVLFFLAYPRVALLRKNPVAVAIGYGLFVWCLMNLVLVPLTRITPNTWTLIQAGKMNYTNAAIQAGILVVCIGAPLTILARRFYSKA